MKPNKNKFPIFFQIILRVESSKASPVTDKPFLAFLNFSVVFNKGIKY